MRTRAGKMWTALLVVALLCTTVVAQGANVTGEDVANSVQKAVGYLRNAGPGRAGGYYRDGTEALKVLALINAGVPVDDPAVVNGVAKVVQIKNEHTYTVALKIQALAAADPKKYLTHIAAAADWLVRTQLRNGMWTYRATRNRAGRGDNSNTQFALLGLHEAAKAGVKIPPGTWETSRKHFQHTQLRDGGWAYNFDVGMRVNVRGPSASYGSMTAAGVASMYICGQQLHMSTRRAFDAQRGVYPQCGRYLQNEVIAKGLEWLSKNFSVTRNPRPGQGGSRGHLYYYLYALERVGMISGLRSFGRHDWYREGAAHLVATQRAGGDWGSQPYEAALCLLFLAKGNRPVLIQKVAWDKAPGQRGFWNRNIHDLENLTAFIDEDLGQRTTWQTTSLDLSVQDLRQSPILLITGHEFPNFSPAELQKLRQFIDAGGTLLFEACCGSDEFETGFRGFAKVAFPEYALRPLAKDHPVFHSLHKIDARTYVAQKLEGIDVGCRTSVFFSPVALSCLWELRDIPLWSDRALKIGANIAAYATGREQLPSRLDKIELPPAARRASNLPEVPRGAVRIARLRHRGDYNADPYAMVNLAAMLRDQARVDVVAKARHLDATDASIYEYPVVFMTGHFTFRLSDAEVQALRKYLLRGGVLVTSACCGQAAFDKSFREMIAKVFPEHKLAPLPGNHPIYGGGVGQPLGELRYRRILADELKRRGTTRPPLEAITIDGRTTVVYSKYDWCCALEGDKPFSCRGYVDADGRKLAMNILLYAISY